MTSDALRRSDLEVLAGIAPDVPGDAGRVIAVDPGSAVAIPEGSCAWLLAGEVMLLRAARPVEVWRAPAPLDIAGTVTGARTSTFTAVVPARVLLVPRAAIPDGALLRALADEARRLGARVDTDVRRDDDTFLPLAEPVPGPWHFRRITGAILVIEGEREKLHAALPREVHLLPGTGGRWLLVLARLGDCVSLDPRDSRRFSYHEVTPFVPVLTAPHGPAFFVPELYPDSWMATILGREIHGFPKRVARVAVGEDGADLIVERRLALRARWQILAPCTAGDLFAGVAAGLGRTSVGARAVRGVADRWNDAGRGLTLPVVVHKRIGSPSTAGATRALDELVRVPFRFDPVRAAHTLSIDAFDVPGGPGVLHGRAVSGWWLEGGFQFGPGRVIARRRGSA
jgi:hypothetical protein